MLPRLPTLHTGDRQSLELPASRRISVNASFWNREGLSVASSQKPSASIAADFRFPFFNLVLEFFLLLLVIVVFVKKRDVRL